MKCNGGTPIELSTVSDALYLPPLILGLFRAIGDDKATVISRPVRLSRSRRRQPIWMA
jgi:hypothetical protein